MSESIDNWAKGDRPDFNANESHVLEGKVCWYCNSETELVTDKEIYGPNSTYGGMYYRCTINADHYVGTYSDEERSLGRVANRELRQWKRKGHEVFDPLWNTKNSVFKTQRQAYKWLSEAMELPLNRTHFGMFTKEDCEKAIELTGRLRTKSGSDEII